MLPKCLYHGDRYMVPLDPEDADECPEQPEMTHRCAACGRQFAGEAVTPCA